jgi:hypothetical protein
LSTPQANHVTATMKNTQSAIITQANVNEYHSINSTDGFVVKNVHSRALALKIHALARKLSSSHSNELLMLLNNYR